MDYPRFYFVIEYSAGRDEWFRFEAMDYTGITEVVKFESSESAEMYSKALNFSRNTSVRIILVQETLDKRLWD